MSRLVVGRDQLLQLIMVDELFMAVPELSYVKQMRDVALPAYNESVRRSCCGEDYHLVHVYACPPAVLNDTLPVEKEIVELRPTKWSRLENVVRRFLAGDDVDQLLAAAYAQPVRHGVPCCQCGTPTDGTSEFCSHECADRYYHG